MPCQRVQTAAAAATETASLQMDMDRGGNHHASLLCAHQPCLSVKHAFLVRVLQLLRPSILVPVNLYVYYI
jgi:hypothetical protein